MFLLYNYLIELPEKVYNYLIGLPEQIYNAYSWQVGFNIPATEIMENIIDLHHDIMTILILVSIFVS
jgi:hypothetical protein